MSGGRVLKPNSVNTRGVATCQAVASGSGGHNRARGATSQRAAPEASQGPARIAGPFTWAPRGLLAFVTACGYPALRSGHSSSAGLSGFGPRRA